MGRKPFLVEQIVDGQKIYCLRKAATKEEVFKMFDQPIRVTELLPLPPVRVLH